MGFHIWETMMGMSEKCAMCACEKECAPEECPERPITEEEKEKIKKKDLDYRGGKWRTYVNLGSF